MFVNVEEGLQFYTGCGFIPDATAHPSAAGLGSKAQQPCELGRGLHLAKAANPSAVALGNCRDINAMN